jgi:peptide/nickel transport system substrate-binding protein
MITRRAFIAGSAAALAAGGARAQGAALTLGTKLELSTLDPHFFNGFPQSSSHAQVFDSLALLDARLSPRPGLAVAWRNLDPLTWEFRLREGVTFHDGSPFTADDVIATLERVPNVPNSPNSFSQYTRTIAATEKRDDHTIRFRTAVPSPMLANDLARVLIIPKRLAGATTAEFNAGRAMVGTGPYKLVEWATGERLALTRNPAYWGGTPTWARVTERILKTDPARLAALLTGEVDAIDEIPAADRPRLRQDNRFAIAAGPAAVVHYIALDSARDESPFVAAKDGQPPLRGNPLRDRRVRKALSLAINRALICERLMEGAATPASQYLPPTFDGTSQRLQPDPFDLDRARTLLREAGLPDGFKITLHATSDRYPQDRAIAQAIGQTWSRAGLQVAIETVPGPVFFTQASQQRFSAFIAQYGTDDASQGPRALIHTFDSARGFGTANRVRYSNRAVDEAIERALVEMDDERRRALLAAAIEASLEDQAFIPVLYPSWDYAARRDLEVTPRPERRFNALMIRPR